MATYCLDTGIVIAFLKQQPSIFEKIASLSETNSMYITSIVLCELYKGVYRSSNLAYELSILEKFIETVPVLDFSIEACRIFGEDFVRLQKEGNMIDDFDVMVASIAKAHGATVVTRNKKHFMQTGVAVEEW
ncbi:type II toxin-antitoxin system VapC family toxin [Candidatus Pacearchaeota archaeon]|nr:type II toxin-antitoxin system VapC family toxin [Candidatus Pacearchaeota archaeon]